MSLRTARASAGAVAMSGLVLGTVIAFIGGFDYDRYLYVLTPALLVLTFGVARALWISPRRAAVLTVLQLVAVRFGPELLRVRIEKAERYNRELPGIKGLEIPYVPPYATHTYQRYCLRLTKDCTLDREELMTNLLHRASRRAAG